MLGHSGSAGGRRRHTLPWPRCRRPRHVGMARASKRDHPRNSDPDSTHGHAARRSAKLWYSGSGTRGPAHRQSLMASTIVPMQAVRRTCPARRANAWDAAFVAQKHDADLNRVCKPSWLVRVLLLTPAASKKASVTSRNRACAQGLCPRPTIQYIARSAMSASNYLASALSVCSSSNGSTKSTTRCSYAL